MLEAAIPQAWPVEAWPAAALVLEDTALADVLHQVVLRQVVPLVVVTPDPKADPLAQARQLPDTRVDHQDFAALDGVD